MIDAFVSLKSDVDMLKTAFGNLGKVGAVEEIDKEKGYRLKLGDGDDGPYLSPWYPHPETGKSSVPLKKGQVVGVLNPSGDPRQGILIRAGYSDENSSPNDNMEANVFEDAGIRVQVSDGALLITADGTTFLFSGAGFVQSGGKQEHDGQNTGKNHTHKDVTPGGANTGTPNP